MLQIFANFCLKIGCYVKLSTSFMRSEKDQIGHLRDNIFFRKIAQIEKKNYRKQNIARQARMAGGEVYVSANRTFIWHSKTHKTVFWVRTLEGLRKCKHLVINWDMLLRQQTSTYISLASREQLQREVRIYLHRLPITEYLQRVSIIPILSCFKCFTAPVMA